MLPDSEAPTVLNALAAKYGLMGWWTTSDVTGSPATRAVVGITVP